MITTNQEKVDLKSIKSITLNQIDTLIDIIPNHIKCVSFDCFDTILYRYLHEPTDIFYHLNENLPDHLDQIAPSVRIQAEHRRYQYNYARNGNSQCTLEEIYQTAFPDKDINIINQYVENEIKTEAKFSYIPDTIINLLIRLASKFKIIITSDIYLSKNQLQNLLSNHLSSDVISKISLISTSSDYKRSKGEDLFPVLLKKLMITPNQLLHIGDNYTSDYSVPSQYGINAIRLIHSSDDIKAIFRMLPFSAAFTDNTIRHTRGLGNIFAKQIFNKSSHLADAKETIGYVTLGPIMYSFSCYLANEVALIENKHPGAKLIFLLRDAYLPHQCFQQVTNRSNQHLVRISRFSAFASSFTSPNSIYDYLSNKISPENFETICLQLLLPVNIKSNIISQANKSDKPAVKFRELICQKNILNLIIKQSNEYKKRLYKYLSKTINLTEGDHLVFIDLGYSGTTQHRLKDILLNDYAVTIEGRYLISLNTPPYDQNKTGLLNSSYYHHNSLIMLVTYIATLEQLCTAPDSSVVDFDENGDPILSDLKMSDNQMNTLLDIQNHVYKFIDDAMKDKHLQQLANQIDYLRDNATLNLCRLIYFPTKAESDLLSGFSHDINMGSSETAKLIDVESNLDALIRRGYLNSLKNPTSTSRMNYPAEWRYISLQLAVNLMVQHRHDFTMTLSDLSHQKLNINIFIDINGQQSIIPIEAEPTYHGYFILNIPVSSHQKSGILIGELIKYFELYSAHLIEPQYIYTKNEDTYSLNVKDTLSMFNIEKIDHSLFSCTNNESMIIHDAAALKNISILKVVLRPLNNSQPANELD